jgi:hypothetical protein
MWPQSVSPASLAIIDHAKRGRNLLPICVLVLNGGFRRHNMADDKQGRPSLRDFNPHADRNGQDFGQDDPRDVARPDELQRELARNPNGPAETARLASGRPELGATGSMGATDATEAETPPENLKRISDPSLPASGASATQDAIERATSTAGQDDKE